MRSRILLLLVSLALYGRAVADAHARTQQTPVDTTASAPSPAADPPRGPELGVRIQTVGYVSADPSAEGEGFAIESARLTAEGVVEGAVAYELEADFSDRVVLKDAVLRYEATPFVALRAGKFKSGFSFGELVSSARTPFVERPRVVDALNVGRNVGVEAQVASPSGLFAARAGVYDEAAPVAGADRLLYTGRVTWRPPVEGASATVGINAAYDDAAGAFREGLRYGADVHVVRGPYFVTAEALAVSARTWEGISSGAYVTAGWALAPAHQVRARWDYVEATAAEIPPHVLGLGYTFLPNDPIRIEVDLILPAAPFRPEHAAALVNVQLNF